MNLTKQSSGIHFLPPEFSSLTKYTRSLDTASLHIGCQRVSLPVGIGRAGILALRIFFPEIVNSKGYWLFLNTYNSG